MLKKILQLSLPLSLAGSLSPPSAYEWWLCMSLKCNKERNVQTFLEQSILLKWQPVGGWRWDGYGSMCVYMHVCGCINTQAFVFKSPLYTFQLVIFLYLPFDLIVCVCACAFHFSPLHTIVHDS